jgi:D-serine deaminase-like pyridoxal phosphate-dependent protein
MIQEIDLISPGLLVNPKIVLSNIDWILKQVDNNPQRLRPHIKTHKTREVNQMLLAAGITKFKAARIASSRRGTGCIIIYAAHGVNALAIH